MSRIGVELLLDVEVELQRVGGERLFDLLLAVERLGRVAGHVQRLGRKLRRLAGALDREQDLVEQIEDGGVEILFVGLLLALEVVALGMALGDAAVGLLRGKELARGFLDAAHRRLVAGEDTQVVLLAQAVEELLDLFGRDLGVRADDQQHAASANAVGDLFQPGSGSTSS